MQRCQHISYGIVKNAYETETDPIFQADNP